MTCPDCNGNIKESYCPDCESCYGNDYYECEECHELFTLYQDELEYA